jgi:hypothetical protein
MRSTGRKAAESSIRFSTSTLTTERAVTSASNEFHGLRS